MQISMSELFQTDHVLPGEKPGIFKVSSATDMQTWYTLRFDTPSCECSYWQHTHLPCKHLLQCLDYTSTGNGISSLRVTDVQKCSLYNNNNNNNNNDNNNNNGLYYFITLDEVVISNTAECKLQDTSVSSSSSPEAQNTIEECTTTQVPGTTVPVSATGKKAAKECRELMSEIKKLTFSVEDTVLQSC